MDECKTKHDRIRHTATGALAALIVVGAIAGGSALAANPQAKTGGRVAPKALAAKAASFVAPDKSRVARPPVDQQPFFNAVHRLVQDGKITAAQGQIVDAEILTGRVDTDTLAARGFNAAALQAVQQALGNAKRALAPGGHSAVK
jgi:hypothetical protein